MGFSAAAWPDVNSRDQECRIGGQALRACPSAVSFVSYHRVSPPAAERRVGSDSQEIRAKAEAAQSGSWPETGRKGQFLRRRGGDG